jgi:hypothetical protein
VPARRGDRARTHFAVSAAAGQADSFCSGGSNACDELSCLEYSTGNARLPLAMKRQAASVCCAFFVMDSASYQAYWLK